MGFLLAIAILSVLVVVHELGHALAARLVGEQVLEFSVGFWKELAHFYVGKTRVKICVLPLGGYVKHEMRRDQPRLFAHGFILLAGPLANFLLAYGLFTIVGYQTYERRVDTSMIGEVQIEHVVVADVLPDSELQIDDIILAVNETSCADSECVALAIKSTPQRDTITFDVQRGETLLRVNVLSNGQSLVLENIGTLRRDFIDSMALTVDLSKRIIGMLIELIQAPSVQELASPIGLGQALSQQHEESFESMILLVAILSISVGLFNLLPIPPLDGGGLLFLILRRMHLKTGLLLEFVVATVTVPAFILLSVIIVCKDIWNLF